MTQRPAPMRVQATTPPAIARRGVLAAGVAALALGAPSVTADQGCGHQDAGRDAAVAADWRAFCERFVLPDGRIIDTGNGGISHSEGQGAGLLFAVRAGDRAGFERILAWTRGALRRPGDALLAWAYRPGAAVPVPDRNTATDGDLLVAWALAEAAEAWGERAHRDLAATMARDLLRRVVLPHGGGALLLPGAEGFLKPDHVVVNPSYYLIAAFRRLALLAPGPEWRALEAGGAALLEAARFGRWRLPPDWVALPRGAGRPSPAPGWPPRFSYDALRVPLNLAWAGQTRSPALRAIVDFWADPAHPVPPAWVDLRTDAVAPYAGDAGLLAVARLALAALLDGGHPAALPEIAEAAAYYPAVLTLQARLAWAELRLPGTGVAVAA